MKKIYYLFLAAFLMPILTFAQPPNDNCSGAIPITIGGDAVIADNTDATYSGPQGSCLAPLGDMTDGNVWFIITVTDPMTLIISAEEGTSDDSQLTLFTIEDCGGPNEAYTEVACSEDKDFYFDYMSEILTGELQPGTYYLAASTFSRADAASGPISNAGTYSISVSSASMPENDTCEGAIELIVDGPAEIADNSISTVNGPSGTCYNIGQVVGETWFKFTATESMNVRIHTEDIDSGDSQVSVFTIDGCGTEDEIYTEVACNDDYDGGGGMSQIDMFDVQPGTYYIKAGTYHEFFTGAYEIMLQSIVEVPANDSCSGATPIVIGGDAVIADNTGATYSGPEGSCYAPLGDMTDGNVWFTITVTETMALLITSEEGTSDDSQLTLFTIEDCGGPNEVYTEIACNEDEDWFNYMAVILTGDLEPGTYYLSASTFSREDAPSGPISNAGTFSISVVSASMPINDTCEGAIELIVDGPAEIADNSISTVNGPSGTCYSIGQVVGETWFKFTATELMDVRIHTEDISSGDSQVSVFTIEGCGTEDEIYTEVACNDDYDGGDGMSQIDMFNVEPGTYYIKAGTYHEFFTGAYEIMLQSFSNPPVNSACEDADIQTLEIDGPTAGVTGSATDAIDTEGISQPHVWEAFTIDDCADVTIDMCGTPVAPDNYFIQIIDSCPIDESSNVIDASNYDIENCDEGEISNLTLKFVDLPAGTYFFPVMSTPEYTVLDDYSVNFTAVTCEAIDPVGLSEADKANFSVYPNPSNGQFTIGNVEVSGSYTIEVIDLTGRIIHTQVSALTANTEAKINLNEVAAGVYMVKMINTNDNTQAVERIVIR